MGWGGAGMGWGWGGVEGGTSSLFWLGGDRVGVGVGREWGERYPVLVLAAVPCVDKQTNKVKTLRTSNVGSKHCR